MVACGVACGVADAARSKSRIGKFGNDVRALACAVTDLSTSTSLKK